MNNVVYFWENSGWLYDCDRTKIMDSFSRSPLNTSIIKEKNLGKDFQKILNTLRCDMVTSFSHYNGVTDRRAASVRLFVFLSFLRADIGV